MSGGGVAVRPFFASDDLHLLRSMVAAGHGIGFLPNHPFAPGVRGEELEVIRGLFGRDLDEVNS